MASQIGFQINDNYLEALKEEGYQLSITDKNILIKANTSAGIFYGFQSIFQYLLGIRTNEEIQIPVVETNDKKISLFPFLFDVFGIIFCTNLIL